MAYIETVLGPIEPEQLGVTMMHEHILWNQLSYQEPVDETDPEQAFLLRPICMEDLGQIRTHMYAHRDNALQENVEEAIPEVQQYVKYGGKSLVDCSSIGLSRDPEGNRRVSRECGVQIIMATGMYKEAAVEKSLRELSAAKKAELFEKELFEGIDGTTVKAGVIGELGVSEEFPDSEKGVLIAGAAAQKSSGVPILIHQPGFVKLGHEILNTLEQNGADLEKTVLCHCDVACKDIPYLTSLLSRGVTLSFDQFSYEFEVNIPGWKGLWLPRDMERVRCVVRLCELGFNSQIVLSQDLCFKICYLKYGGNGYAHVLRNIVPMLRKEGVTEASLHQILTGNPARILAIQ